MKFLFIALFVSLFLLGCINQNFSEVKVVVLDFPDKVADDLPFIVKWRVEGSQEKITHSAIHFDFQPHDANFKAYNEVSAVYIGNSPKEFHANIHALKVGFVFFRAHAIINGKNFYSEEFKTAVVPYDPDFNSANRTSCPECLSSSNWSACVNSKQERTSYKCDENTNFWCQGFEETRNC